MGFLRMVLEAWRGEAGAQPAANRSIGGRGRASERGIVEGRVAMAGHVFDTAVAETGGGMIPSGGATTALAITLREGNEQ
jgi:hypothetical protein